MLTLKSYRRKLDISKAILLFGTTINVGFYQFYLRTLLDTQQPSVVSRSFTAAPITRLIVRHAPPQVGEIVHS